MTNTTKPNSKALTFILISIILMFGFGFSELLRSNKDVGILPASPQARNIKLLVNWKPARDLTIIYYIDKKMYELSWVKDELTWTTEIVAFTGNIIELVAEQPKGSSGFVQCAIYQDEEMVAYQHRNDGSECVLLYTVT